MLGEACRGLVAQEASLLEVTNSFQELQSTLAHTTTASRNRQAAMVHAPEIRLARRLWEKGRASLDERRRKASMAGPQT